MFSEQMWWCFVFSARKQSESVQCATRKHGKWVGCNFVQVWLDTIVELCFESVWRRWRTCYNGDKKVMKELCTFVYTELPAKSCLSKKFVAYAAYAEGWAELLQYAFLLLGEHQATRFELVASSGFSREGFLQVQ